MINPQAKRLADYFMHFSLAKISRTEAYKAYDNVLSAEGVRYVCPAP